MTESAVPSPEKETMEFLQLWASAVSAVLGQIAGKEFPAALAFPSPGEAAAALETDIHIRATAGGGLRGELHLRLPRASALRLAQQFVGEPVDENKEFTAENREAVEELLRQIAGQVAVSCNPRWGEVSIRTELSEAPAWPAAVTAMLNGEHEQAPQMLLELRLSAALAAALRVIEPAVDAAETAAAPDVRASLGSLMDVELNVSLRFGTRRMLLSDILDLGAGAVVELDRHTDEPVDLLLDGKLVARGEVVVIDGNFGLRVTELGALLQP